MNKYMVYFKESTGNSTWTECKRIEKAASKQEAIYNLLDRIECDYYECDFIHLEQGQYSNGAEYTVEDENNICVVCYKDIKAILMA